MVDPKKVMLTPYVHQAIVDEHARIRAELREQGPAFDVTSITYRLRVAKEQAEAEEKANGQR